MKVKIISQKLYNKNERAWQRMLSGRKLDILSPSPLDIEIEDIALGLSRVARWNGQTIGNHCYSVAQHSLLVEELFTQNNPKSDLKWRLAALLHDGPEYVIGDLITPFKYALNNSYRTVENNLMQTINLRFGLPAILPKAIELNIKKADKSAAWVEAVQIGGYSEKEALQILKKPIGELTNKVNPLSPKEAVIKFLKRFHELI